MKTSFTLILPSSGMFRSVSWFSTDLSGLPIGTIFKGQDVQEGASLLKMGPIIIPKTSVLNKPALRKIPEDGRIKVNLSGSLGYRILTLCFVTFTGMIAFFRSTK
jgi:hypothetical protein